MELSQLAKAELDRYRQDHPYYCQSSLTILDKSGEVIPFTLNRAQLYAHEQLEKQKKETGKIRAIVLKGRQQGMSTYISSRFYAQSNWKPNRGTFILSHHSKTTDALFRMVDRFHRSVPEPIRLETPVHNLRQLEFSNGSRYEVGTAKTGEVGRGFTIHFFHGSEVAFYDNTDELKTGVLQAIADVPGTEIILESTANGVGNMFHQMCMDALAGKSDYILIFIPWFWEPSYAVDVPPDFQLTDEEYELQRLYELTPQQLAWRRKKITNLGSETLFKQEYPCTPHEAFQVSGERLFDSMAVAAAKKSTKTDPGAPIILGVDPARVGDRTVLLARQGLQIIQYDVYQQMNEMELAGIIANKLQQKQVDHVFIDFGMGYGTVDRLRELGFSRYVTGVQFGGQSMYPEQYKNKRAEMAGLFCDWMNQPGANIPDLPELEIELMAIPDFIIDSSGKKQLVPKKDIIQQFGKSTDIFDAGMLTFAFPVKRPELPEWAGYTGIANRKGKGLRTTNRISDIMKRK